MEKLKHPRYDAPNLIDSIPEPIWNVLLLMTMAGLLAATAFIMWSAAIADGLVG